MKEQSLTRTLAWFSLGLGAAEPFAPRQLGRLIGLPDDHSKLLRACGLREIGAGLGLMQGNPTAFLWARVAGDAMDLGLLGAALNSDHHDRRRLGYAIGAVAGVTALDVLAAVLHGRDNIDPQWRVQHSDDELAGIEHTDPAAHRASTDAAWSDSETDESIEPPRQEVNSPATIPPALTY